MTNQGERPEGKEPAPKLNIADSSIKKRVAEMLVNGSTHAEIASNLGYKYKNSLSLMLKRAGGTDSVIRETLGEAGVQKYREQVRDTRDVASSAGGSTTSEGSLIEDVRRDISQGRVHGRLDDLGGRDTNFERREIKNSGPTTEHAVPAGHAKKIIREIDRAAKKQAYRVEVQALVNSVIDSIAKREFTAQNIPVTVLYTTTSTATGGSLENATANMKGESIVLRVRLPKLQTSDARTHEARHKVAELAGVLRHEIEKFDQPDSALGKMLHSFGKQMKIELQLMWGSSPIVLASKTFP